MSAGVTTRIRRLMARGVSYRDALVDLGIADLMRLVDETQEAKAEAEKDQGELIKRLSRVDDLEAELRRAGKVLQDEINLRGRVVEERDAARARIAELECEQQKSAATVEYLRQRVAELERKGRRR